MATRSSIGILNEDGTVTGIYCHWDGYVKHNGNILYQFYRDEAKVRELISNGDLSILGREIGSKHPFDNPHKYMSEEYKAFQDLYEGQCLYYGRDRGEKDVEARTYTNVADFIDNRGEEYNYLYVNGTWFVNQYGATDGKMVPVLDMVEVLLKSPEHA